MHFFLRVLISKINNDNKKRKTGHIYSGNYQKLSISDYRISDKLPKYLHLAKSFCYGLNNEMFI